MKRLLLPAAAAAALLLQGACRTVDRPPAALTQAELDQWDAAQIEHENAALALKILTTPYRK